MGRLNTYRVGGFCFTAEGMPFEPDNLKPFRVVVAGESPIFSLKVVPSLTDAPAELLYRTDDGPQFPEIAIFTKGGGYRLEMRPLPHLPVACEMTTDSGFRQAELKLSGGADLFALNNSMMLLYAFSAATLGVLEMHASVIMNDGRGYLFLGKSGTGKSTHSRLWMEHIPGSVLLNDDNPILRLMEDGSVRVYGSPWSGKTPCYKALDVPAGAIVRLSQAPANRIERLSMVHAYASLMSSASGFRPLRHLADGWHATMEGIAAAVPCYHLECLPDREAALLCYNTIHG